MILSLFFLVWNEIKGSKIIPLTNIHLQLYFQARFHITNWLSYYCFVGGGGIHWMYILTSLVTHSFVFHKNNINTAMCLHVEYAYESTNHDIRTYILNDSYITHIDNDLWLQKKCSFYLVASCIILSIFHTIFLLCLSILKYTICIMFEE